MGTAFAGIVRSPLTSVIMIFEMTRDYAIIVPLMISNLVSFVVSQALQHEPIYEALASQEGVVLPTSEGRHGEGMPRVSDLLRPLLVLSLETSIEEAVETMRRNKVDSLPLGSEQELRALATERELLKGAAAGFSLLRDVYPDTRPYPYVYRDQSASIALQKMGAAEVGVLPVVSRANLHEAAGMITVADVLAAFRIRNGSEES
jgi:CIC family chloride channel protein